MHSTSSAEPSGLRGKCRAYLSGGMEYAGNEGRDWRLMLQEWLERELDWDVFNPNIESDRIIRQRFATLDFRELKMKELHRYRTIVSELVDLDCREIAERSDVVICYWDESAMRGAGTKGELTMARYSGKPVYMVTSTSLNEIPGWILACTTEFFSSFDALKTFLTGRYSKRR